MKTKIYLVTHPDCPPCQFVKRTWLPKLAILFEVVELDPSEIPVTYTPFFFLLNSLSEIVALNSNSYTALVKDIYEKQIS